MFGDINIVIIIELSNSLAFFITLFEYLRNLNNDNKRCKTTGCITLLNQKLSSNKIIPLPNGNKNSAGAQKTYNTILKNLKKPKEIEECAQYNYGFYNFIEQLKGIKTILENEE